MKFHASRNLPGILVVLLLTCHSVDAYQRYVVINNVLMNTSELAFLDELHGEYIPDGRYWLNINNGEWGYEGGPAQGVLGGKYYGNSTISRGCNGQFDYDCKKANFCEQNPGICP